MEIQLCSFGDFHEIVNDLPDFWGSDHTMYFHHPMFYYEFGNTAFVIKEENKVIAYMFGFLSQTSNTGYVHLLAVRKKWQRNGLGNVLYNHFIAYAKAHECKKLKAITNPGNYPSISFHKKLGMKLIGMKNEEGIEIIEDYSGNGQDRVVFEKEI
jgi:GNAT superfamily N-acetyltransferase